MSAIRTHIKLCIGNLVAPSGPLSFWDTPTDVVWEVYRWLISTAADYRDPDRWGETGPWEKLYGKPYCVNVTPYHAADHGISGPAWAGQLRERFLSALLCSTKYSPAIAAWRADLDLNVYHTIYIPVRHYRPLGKGGPVASNRLALILDRMLTASGKLPHIVNGCHPGARDIYGAHLVTYPEGHSLLLAFGYDGSRWWRTLAGQGKREPFPDFVLRAAERFQELTGIDPAKEQP